MSVRFDEIPSGVRSLWAKSGEGEGHGLLCHLMDVAAVAEAILLREPPSTLAWAGEAFGLPAETVPLALGARAGLHDLGKATPGFQAKWEEGKRRVQSAGLSCPDRLVAASRHDAACFDLFSQVFGATKLEEGASRDVARALAAHHGYFPGLPWEGGMEPSGWREARAALLQAYWETLAPARPLDAELSAPVLAWFAGLVSVSDWIGSSREWFPHGERGATLISHWAASRALAQKALQALGWPAWAPLLPTEASTDALIQRMLGRQDLEARPLQLVGDELLAAASGPTLLLVEAPMGEGKTELAFLSHLRLQHSNGHRGFYVALPTQATGNALFGRAHAFLEAFRDSGHQDLQRVHGGAALEERLPCLPDVDGSPIEGVRSAAWFASRKRALLSPYGVGTVDQALLSILSVKHHFVRLWGLSNRLVVLDEVHAYDTYTGGLIEALLRWLKEIGSSVVLMSATLPEKRRAALLQAWGATKVPDLPYPRVLRVSQGQIEGCTFPVRDQAPIKVQGQGEDLEGLAQGALEAIQEGGCAAIIVNTVQRAQCLYTALKARLEPGIELLLFHARFPADERLDKEAQVLRAFGVGPGRPQRAILVATQVVEQSLDVDFDVLFTDLAPIDLLLQRAGRLHRHRRSRPGFLTEPRMVVAGLLPEREPDLRSTAWGYVYDPYVLLSTWKVAVKKPLWTLPGDIDRLVQEVYSGDPFESEEREALLKLLDRVFGEHLAKEQDMRQRALNAALDAGQEPAHAFLKTPLRDEDEASNHLLVATRLGEPSCAIVPVHEAPDGWRVTLQDSPFDPHVQLSDELARRLAHRQLRVARKGLVQALLASPVPASFEKHPLLRGVHPLALVEGEAEAGGQRMRLNPELGLVYLSKEDA